MRSINKVIIIGNLTRDPEMKETQGGQTITTFGVATNREWMTSGSERKKSTEFHEVVAWSKLGEICNQYLKKGKLVYIEGYLKTRSWEGEDGEKRFKTEVVAEDMVILSKRGDAGGYGDDDDDDNDHASPAQEESSQDDAPADSDEDDMF